MFVFDNLNELDDKNLGILLRNVENDVLVVALKGANEVLRDRMYGCMSQRAAQSVQDDIEERGPMRLAEVLDAQRDMLAIARRHAYSGTRPEEPQSALQSLMRISYAGFSLQNKHSQH